MLITRSDLSGMSRAHADHPLLEDFAVQDVRQNERILKRRQHESVARLVAAGPDAVHSLQRFIQAIETNAGSNSRKFALASNSIK